jgi:hypothetical protein
MSLLDQLERKCGRFAVPHLTVWLLVGQVVVFLASQGPNRPAELAGVGERLLLIPDRVLAGEWWRLASFLIVPTFGNVLCALFCGYLFYLMGTSLELNWGTFRYNVYLLIGYLATVAVSFVTPGRPASNGPLLGSVFLAFAFLFPDFELFLFFVLPVKIKWLALITWVAYFGVAVFGGWQLRLLVLAAVGNFLVFFGKDIWQRVRDGQRRMAVQAARLTAKPPAYYHRCTVCGITDRTHPGMEFRYCSKCNGHFGYCTDHLRDHTHITEGALPSRS